MEKFFTIDKDSKFYKDYVQYKHDVKTHAKAFDDFCKSHGIESTRYLPSDNSVMIIPTVNDLNKFGHLLTKRKYDDGIRTFRKNCKIVKDWTAIAKHLPEPYKPTYFEYGMRVNGYFSSRCFMLGDTLYGSIECNTCDFDLLYFMTEIKGSEFYTALETTREKKD